MVSIYPQLGGSHIVEAGGVVRFVAFLDEAYEAKEGELQLWTNLSGTWREHAFEEQQEGNLDSILIAQVSLQNDVNGHTFEYTFRRLQQSGHIEWLSQANGLDNGRITCVDAAASALASGFPLDGTDSKFTVIESSSATKSGITTRQLTVDLQQGIEGDIESFYLGSLPGFLAGLSLERTKPTWFTPRILRQLGELSSTYDSQLLLTRTLCGVVALLPVSTPSACCTLRGSADGGGGAWLRVERDTNATAEGYCVIAQGKEWQLLDIIEACTREARKIVDTPAHTDEVKGTDAGEEPGSLSWSLSRSVKPIFCTWNSLGQDYTLSGVLDRLEALQTAGLLEKMDAVLLDDGWQDVGRIGDTKLRGLRSFGTREGWMDVETMDGGRKAEFDNGDSPKRVRRIDSGFAHSRSTSRDLLGNSSSPLKTAVDIIKSRYPTIKRVGVWMTLEGYWNGIHPSGSLSEVYKLAKMGLRAHEAQIPHSPPVRYIHLPAVEEAKRFWEEYFTVLSEAGIAFVKIDNQAGLEYLQGEGAAALRSTHAHHAKASATAAFGAGNLINCMAHSPRLYSGLLSKDANAAASFRTSDDFFPFEAESHRFHIAFNASMSLLHRELALVPDFDMFTTHHELAHYHAQLRVFSNGPIYLTDDKTPNNEVVQRLGGLNTAGEYTLVKSDASKSVKLPGTVFDDPTGMGEGSALKFAMPVRAAGGAMIGFWNCRGGKARTKDVLTERDAAEALALGDCHSGDYILYTEQGKQIRKLASLNMTAAVQSATLSSKVLIPLVLEGESFTTVTVTPVIAFGELQIAVIGLVDKYAGLCAVRSIHEGTASRFVTDTVADTVTDETTALQALEPAPRDDNEPESRDLDAPVAESQTSHGDAHVTRANINRQTKGSRLWALLFFFRSELRSIRQSLARDFWAAPFVTLYREIKAALGGASTLPDDEEAETAAPARRESYGTFENARVAVQTPSDTVKQIEIRDAAADQSEVCRAPMKEPAKYQELVIHVSVSGQLAWTAFDVDSKDIEVSVKIEGKAIDQQFVSRHGHTFVLDMPSAIEAMGPSRGTHVTGDWKVSLSKQE